MIWIDDVKMGPRLLLLLVFVIFACSQALEQWETNEVQRTFLYFGYGSNMLSSRIHKNSPSAKSVTIARLKDHYLDFTAYSPSWRGSVSTIVPSKGAKVWGVVWEIDIEDMPNLDRQEGVESGTYFPKTVTVKTPAGEYLECRTYQETVLPDTYVPPRDLPPERQPSPAYKYTIIEGAKEHNIPSYYMKFLKSFRDNGYLGPVTYM